MVVVGKDTGRHSTEKTMPHDRWVSLFVPMTRTELVAAAVPFNHMNSSLFLDRIPVLVDLHPSGNAARRLELARQHCRAIPKNSKLDAYHLIATASKNRMGLRMRQMHSHVRSK